VRQPAVAPAGRRPARGFPFRNSPEAGVGTFTFGLWRNKQATPSLLPCFGFPRSMLKALVSGLPICKEATRAQTSTDSGTDNNTVLCISIDGMDQATHENGLPKMHTREGGGKEGVMPARYIEANTKWIDRGRARRSRPSGVFVLPRERGISGHRIAEA